MVLILAVRGGELLLFVTGVLVEDAPFSAAAERDLAPAVDHDLRARVVDDLRRLRERDGVRSASAGERDDTAFGDRRHERFTRATRCGAGADDRPRVRDVLGLSFGWRE